MKTDNLILIKGGAYNDVKTALTLWIGLYAKSLPEGLCFQLFKNGRGNHLIQADQGLDNEHFFYLVNYLKYPEGIDYSVEVIGFTTGNNQYDLEGRELMVYISSTDTEYDNVSVTTSEGAYFKIDFGGNILELGDGRDYSYPVNLRFGPAECFSVQTVPKRMKTEKSENPKPEKRFKLLSTIILASTALSFFLYVGSKDFIEITSLICLSVVIWLFVDSTMLQVRKLYFTAIGIGVIFLLYGLSLTHFLEFEHRGAEVIRVTTSQPLLFLVIQGPLRLLFIKLFKREPRMERPAPSIADFLYVILLLGSFLLPLILLGLFS